MIIRIPALDRHFVDLKWMQAYWLFSYAEWYDPGNVRLGKLRVFNEGLIQPGEGFDLHFHEELEIVTIVLSGQLTITDDTGARAVVHEGDVHRITAGTGIRHSEKNLATDPARYCQIWVFPDEPGLIPSYEKKTSGVTLPLDRLRTVASGRGDGEAVSMHADASIAMGRFSPGFAVDYPVVPDRCLFLYVMSGSLALRDMHLDQGDQLRVKGEDQLLPLVSTTASSVIIVDVAA
jgi:redox-sensitive bicupin YhaK (pirin superfamily)